MVSRILLSLFLVTALDAHAAWTVRSLQHVRELAIETEIDTPQASYARDDQFEFLGTPNGLYRATRIANAPLQLIAFANESVNAVAVDAGVLYVSRGEPNFAVWPQHTFLRSRDHGVTFEPVGTGLQSCVVPSECGYLVPRQISFAPGRIFVSAGGNVIVTGDDGATWKVLHGATSTGKPEPQTCPVTYERIDGRMLLGGECPLDFGYLASGTLRPDLLDWVSAPVRLTSPEMENRNVQLIRDLGNGIVLAGIEGALMKSTDGGATFHYVIHYDISDSEKYPYIGHLAASSLHNGLLVIGGFDKANLRAYLAYSPDYGVTWVDVSSLVQNATFVSTLAEDADGRMLVAAYGDGRLALLQLIVEGLPRRRSARH